MTWNKQKKTFLKTNSKTRFLTSILKNIKRKRKTPVQQWSNNLILMYEFKIMWRTTERWTLQMAIAWTCIPFNLPLNQFHQCYHLYCWPELCPLLKLQDSGQSLYPYVQQLHHMHCYHDQLGYPNYQWFYLASTDWQSQEGKWREGEMSVMFHRWCCMGLKWCEEQQKDGHCMDLYSFQLTTKPVSPMLSSVLLAWAVSIAECSWGWWNVVLGLGLRTGWRTCCVI